MKVQGKRESVSLVHIRAKIRTLVSDGVTKEEKSVKTRESSGSYTTLFLRNQNARE